MKPGVLICSALLTFLTAGAIAQDYPGADAMVIRGLYYPGPKDRTDEIYIFPLAATETGLAFVSCPFMELPDGSGQEETACRLEWLEAAGDEYRPTRREDVNGCTIADHENNDCPGFTGEGFSHGNSVKLLDSLRRTYPTPVDLFADQEVTTNILPFLPPGLAGTMQISEHRAHQLQFHFGVFDTCAAYEHEPAFAEACGRATGALADETSILGVTAMVIGERGVVCVVVEDWSIPACSRTR